MTVALALPAAAQQNNQQDQTQADDGSTFAYALQGDADAFRLGVGPGGLSLGFARSNADSVPTAQGLASAECQFDPEGNATCVEEATEESSYPGNEGNNQPSCAEPAPPPPLGDVLSLTEGCALSMSGLEDQLPFTRNETTAGPIDINLDFSAAPGPGGEVENVKDQIIAELQKIIDRSPPGNPVADLASQILEALQTGEVGEIELGPSSSDIDPDAGVITVTSTAKGPIIRLLGVPAEPVRPVSEKDEAAEGQQAADPLYEGCDITTDDEGNKTAWLFSIEVGEAKASALIDVASRTVDAGETNATAVSVTGLDPSTPEDPTDCRTETIAEGTDAAVIAEGTPIQSSIFVGGKRTEVGDDFATAEAAGVSINLFEGNGEGGGPPPIVIGAARANASVATRIDTPEPTPTPSPTPSVQGNPPEEPRVLPETGGEDYLPYAIVLLVAAAAVGVGARRLGRR